MRECPLCSILINPETKNKAIDSCAIFGIVLRDVMPMDKIINLICEDHKAILHLYYETIIDSYKKDFQELINPVKTPEPDRNSN